MQRNRSKNMQDFVLLAFFVAIEILFSVVPFLGYIDLPFIRSTTLHIPVILAGCLLGVKGGAITGFVFGASSFLTNTFRPNATSFLFTPVFSGEGVFADVGSFWSIIVCFVPRILIGVFAALIFKAICKIDKTKLVALGGAAVVGSLTNTILVMAGAWIFFAEPFAAAKKVAVSGLFKVIMAVVGTNGVMEAIAAVVITVIVGKVLLVVRQKQQRL
jgi:uncharacterized membrane protein